MTERRPNQPEFIERDFTWHSPWAPEQGVILSDDIISEKQRKQNRERPEQEKKRPRRTRGRGRWINRKSV